MANKPIYQFYAELDEYKPKMWRRFQVAGNITVARLAYTVMTLFEMTASHLFAVEVPWAENVSAELRSKYPEGFPEESDIAKIADVPPVWRYEVPGPEPYECEDEEGIELLDATKYAVSRVMEQPGGKLGLNYDFGDDWWVSLTLESVIADADLPGKELPRVLDGAGFGIIEDCGGVSGLVELRTAFIRKKGTNYKELREWLGVDELDMSAFDIDDMNFRLKKIPRIYKQIYEDRMRPTQRSIDLIDRTYRK